ncbi:MAG: hypothetical protein Q7R34_05880 [Dehalococcoidia bacterium]|nr:hypothetical protein [Dehalococcoidia bacterium]
MVSGRFNPNDFSEIAQLLITENPDESKIRTAVGRIYYSLFLVPLYHFYSNGIVPKGRITKQPKNRRGMHAVLIDDVKRVNTALGGQLDALRQLRIQADYRLLPDHGFENWPNNLQTAQILAESIKKMYKTHRINI